MKSQHVDKLEINTMTLMQEDIYIVHKLYIYIVYKFIYLVFIKFCNF